MAWLRKGPYPHVQARRYIVSFPGPHFKWSVEGGGGSRYEARWYHVTKFYCTYLCNHCTITVRHSLAVLGGGERGVISVNSLQSPTWYNSWVKYTTKWWWDKLYCKQWHCVGGTFWEYVCDVFLVPVSKIQLMYILVTWGHMRSHEVTWGHMGTWGHMRSTWGHMRSHGDVRLTWGVQIWLLRCS